MVHALGEIRRVLAADALLIDLRPLLDQWPVEVLSSGEVRQTGRVTDLPSGLADDEAANRAMAEAESSRWFLREDEQVFPLYYVWDTAREMEAWVETEWEDFISLGEDARRATRSAWALGGADSRVRLQVKMLITRWKAIK